VKIRAGPFLLKQPEQRLSFPAVYPGRAKRVEGWVESPIIGMFFRRGDRYLFINDTIFWQAS
jgi:hypothetical protein